MGEAHTLTIKPIETVYNGYRFRSRLEARWARFFDVQGIEYEYEPEGYDLGDGIWYLPDFWLPQVNMWAEVKAARLNESEREKAQRLVLGSGHPCLLLVGYPDYKEYSALELVYDEVLDPNTYTIAHTKWLETEHRFPAMFCFEPEDFSALPFYTQAVTAARSARFGHRESTNV